MVAQFVAVLAAAVLVVVVVVVVVVDIFDDFDVLVVDDNDNRRDCRVVDLDVDEDDSAGVGSQSLEIGTDLVQVVVVGKDCDGATFHLLLPPDHHFLVGVVVPFFVVLDLAVDVVLVSLLLLLLTLVLYPMYQVVSELVV